MRVRGRSRLWGRCAILAAGGLVAFAALSRTAGSAPGPVPSTQPRMIITPGGVLTSRPLTTNGFNPHRTVTLALIEDYLKKWGVANVKTDPAPDRLHVCFRLLVKSRTQLNGVVQLKMRRDRTLDRLYFAFTDLANVQATHPNLVPVLKMLATLNWQNTLGTYAWDEADGEIRLEYALIANQGMAYSDFVDIINRLAYIADNDLPALRRVIDQR